MTVDENRPTRPTLAYLITEDWFFLSHFAERAVEARKRGYRVLVATRDNGRSAEIRALGLEFFPIDFRRRGLNLLRELRTIQQIRQLYRREIPTLVHHIALKPIIYGALAGGKIPTVNAPVGMGFVYSSKSALARLLRGPVHVMLRLALRRRASVAVFENSEDLRRLIDQGQVRAEQAVLIRGAGVDVNAILSTPEPPPPVRVALIARMLRSKGVVEFVAAARELRREGRAIKFVLVGAPDTENPDSLTEEELRTWHRESVVEWLGFRADVPHILASCHIVALPSYAEGLPKVLLEAMSAGRPIVASDIPGCREAVRDGDNGILVPPRNSAQLAAAIADLADHPERRVQMGSRGRVRAVEEFSSSTVVAETLSLYDQICRGSLGRTLGPAGDVDA